MKTEYPIWEAASTEPSRPVLCGVWFDAEKKTLAASDSYILAEVPCEVEDGDESGIIPAEALKTAKGKSLLVRDGKATLQLANGERSWNLIVGTFPSVANLFDGADAADVPYCINAKLLDRLSRALGAQPSGLPAPAIHPKHPLKKILVTRRDARGIIMPVRMPGTDYAENGNRTPDLSNDEAVVAAARAAVAAMDKRRGKRRAAEAFRRALREAAA